MSSWETSDEDRAAGPVLSSHAAPWTCWERPAERSRRWHCCIKRSTRSATSTRGPKGGSFCCGMTVLYRSSTTPEVPAAPLCRPSRAPSPLIHSVNTTDPLRQRTTKGPSCRPARRDTVVPPTAGRDRDDDIVQLALAILDEELRSWVRTRYRGRASQAEGVLEPNEQSRDAS